jgi:hypothetical protein
MEKRGTPAVALATVEFEALARLQARSMGYPDLRIVTIPHPLGGIAPADAVAKADDAAATVARLFRGETAAAR